MIRKFNYTGRKRIERDRVQIRLVPHLGQAPSFEAAISLGGLALPPNASVYVEVYDMSSYMRFSFGTVDNQVSPSSRQLLDLQSREIFSFRIKVVDCAESHGKVLAVADRLPPISLDAGGMEKESLLAVASADLQEQIWKLDFSNNIPVLVLNSRLEDLGIREMLGSKGLFSTLVLPAAFRQVLFQILLVEKYVETEEDSWPSRWLKFCAGLGAVLEGRELEGEGEAAAEWIDKEAVPAFCRYFEASDRFRKAKRGDEDR